MGGPEDSSVVLIQSPPAHMAHVYEPGMALPMEDRSFDCYDYGEAAQWHHHYGDYSAASMEYEQPRQKQYWARGCRGGAKRNKWKKEAARILAEKGVHVEVSSTSSAPSSGNEDTTQQRKDGGRVVPPSPCD